MSHDTLLHRMIRPPISALARTGVTPNQLTTLRLATGATAAVAFAQGGRVWPALGAGFLLVSMLLDRADGELARATGRTSAEGYRYDLLADGVSTVAIFIGMGIGARETWGPLSVVYGVVAAISVVALFLLMQAVEPSGDAPVSRPFDPDDALLVTPFLIWAGLMAWVVLLAAIITPLVGMILATYAVVRRWRMASRPS